MKLNFHLIFACLVISTVFLLDSRQSNSAEVYKWVDSKGRTHFGDKPPESAGSVKAIEITRPNPPSANPNANQRRIKQQKLLKALSEERQERENLRRKAQADKAKKKKNCANTRRNLAVLERANLLYRKDKDGNRQYADEAQHKQLIQQYKTALKKHC